MMLATATGVPWNTIYLIVGTVFMVSTIIALVVRPIAGRTRRAADAAAKLASDSAEAAAKLVVDASVASNKTALDAADAAAKLNLDAAVRNVTLDARIDKLVGLQESTTKRVDTLVTLQEGHERRLTVLEAMKPS